MERGARLKSIRGAKEPGRGEDASAAGKARKKGKRAPVEKEAPWCVCEMKGRRAGAPYSTF